MLETIGLQNFKKHGSLNVEIPDGLTSITGANAAGKTSLLKGILFALFGAAAAGAKDHLWKWDAEGAKSVGLAMTLPEYGRVTVTRTPTSAKVIAADDGRILASGNTAVTKLIEEALGMAAKDLRTLCYSPQGETQGLLTMGPTAMQQKVEGLAQMETVDKVLGLLSGDINKLSGKLEALPADIDIPKLQLKVEEAQNFLEYNQSELQAVQTNEVSVQAELKKATDAYREGRELSEKRERLTYIIQSVGSDLINTDEALSVLKTRSKEKASLGNIEELTNLTHSITELTAQGTELNNRITEERRVQNEVISLTTQINQHSEEVKTHDAAVLQLNELRPQLATYTQQFEVAADNFNTADARRKELSSMVHNATCPTCGQMLKNVNVEELKAQLAEAEVLVEERKTILDTLRVQLKDCEQAVRRQEALLNPGVAALLEDKNSRLAELNKREPLDLATATATLGNIQVDRQGKRDQHAELSKAIALAEEIAKQIQTQEDRLQALNEKQLKIQSELDSTPVVDLVALSAVVDEATTKSNNLSTFKYNLLGNITRGDTELKAFTTELEQAKRQAEEYRKAQDDKAEAEGLQTYLRKNRSRMASDIWDGLLNFSSALISNTTGGVLSDLSRSNGGDFTLLENGRTIPVTEASGAQRSIVGLALRAAMTKVFYGDNLFLLIDEATADASDETAAAIAGMLASLNMQVVTVSHRAGDVVNAGTILEIK